VAMVYEGDRSRRHQMIFFLLSLFQLLRPWNILSQDSLS
jgi:hypothetical protein